MKVSIVGLGKIGLPLAVQVASHGYEVFGCDSNPEVVSCINRGEAHFKGEPGLEVIDKLVGEGLLIATNDTKEAVAKSNVVLVVIPLVVDASGNPNLRNITDTTKTIGAGLQPGTLVVYETTLPVGTTRGLFAPILERASGLKAGKDFYLAFSPERVYSGKVLENLKQYPKLVGGVNQESSNKATEFYSKILEFDKRPDLSSSNGVWDLGSCEAAELAKLAETTYRDINIAFANHLAVYAESVGVDVYKVISACNSQPFSHIHKPGIAVGGHCIPVYPHFYLQGHPDATLVSAARQVNDSMPAHVIGLLRKDLEDLSGRIIVILGLSYRGGVKESAFSGALRLFELLVQQGALPRVHDPLYSDEELIGMGFDPFHLGADCDGVILQADHVEYLALSSQDFPGAKIFIDGRNFSSTALREGLNTHILGVGDI